MRIVRIATALTASALLVGGLTACGSSGGSGSGDAKPSAAGSSAGGSAASGGTAASGGAAKAELLAAAAVMQQAGSAKVQIASTGSPAGDSTASGVYAWGAKPVLDVQQQGSQGLKVRAVDGTTYLGVSNIQAAALGGKHWVKLTDGNPASPSAAVGGGFQAMSLMIDPAAQLALAAQSGQVGKADAQTVNGTATQHYHATVPVDALVQNAPNLTAEQRTALLAEMKQTTGGTVDEDFYLDSAHHLVRLKEAGQGGASPSAGAAHTTATDYSDLGVKATVTAPPASDQADPNDVIKLFNVLGGTAGGTTN